MAIQKWKPVDFPCKLCKTTLMALVSLMCQVNYTRYSLQSFPSFFEKIIATH